ncbi:MAG: hypothetical protein IH956_03620 [Chloroflexi bacterium]|nr:hypothetical protein [Chloroflexota bacterium]
MKKWFIPLISLTLALAITGSVAGFALTNGESGAADQDPTGTIVVKNGRHKLIDEQVVYDLAQKTAERLLERAKAR